ncbi:ParB/RepB/Spo0J family partition protein [Amycolatopsis sp. WGS_07]|uniref:ParB/RepB/Spo0J family partition protein n=1 Tax=Amycolatopsis sp. WGS_07 TaxID=3076764 RepID=UPI003872EBDE
MVQVLRCRDSAAGSLPEDWADERLAWQAVDEWIEGEQAVPVPIAALRPSDSPRLAGEDCAHARLLASAPAELPPVLVHRPSMRVIDGMHRLQAAQLRGAETVLVRFFDGSAANAFVLGVRLNVAHGLPLSISDRRAAAMRIVASHPRWSDRAIAAATGMSAKTVAAVRRCASEDNPQLRVRLGRDGRVRPLSTAPGRLRASKLLQEKPDASLRQIAMECGISPGTVRDVRDRMARGEDPVPPAQRTGPRAQLTSRPEPARCETGELMALLRKDPSLRLTENGRRLISLLSVSAINGREQQELLGTVPPHCRRTVAELAAACAQAWQELAEKLVEHA